MRIYPEFSILVQGSLLLLLFSTVVVAESMELALDNELALNTSLLDADTTNCTITLTKHTETMTCIFSKPKTHTVNCTRSQRSDNGLPPLRIRIPGVENVTYVPETPESMLNIFVARDLYRDHKAKLKRSMTARGDSDYEARRKQEHAISNTQKGIIVALSLTLFILAVIVFTVALFNTQHMFKMGSSDQKEALDLALQRNDLIDKIRECTRQKQWLQAELAKVKAEEDNNDSDTLSMATIVS